MKDNLQNGRKCDKELISSTYKELQKLNPQRINNKINK
jgi:hypothetical protein